MTTSRIVRGTKVRIFLYICGVLIVTGVIACYNNTLSQLDEARKSSEICHQQEENLSTQLQMISDYKQRLEKSLKTEKAEHAQTKTELNRKFDEEKSKHEKVSSDSSLRYNSLQQHYNLLQTQHDDFKEECSKSQNKQMTEINDLQAKLKEIQEELKKVESSKERLKTDYLQVQQDKETLQNQLKTNTGNSADSQSQINHLTKANHELQEELDKLKLKCPAYESLQPPNLNPETSSPGSALKPLQNVGENPEERRVLSEPSSRGPTKSSTTASSLKVSQGSLNGARPLLIPTVTPKSAKSEGLDNPVPMPYKRFPEGVVPPPEKAAELDNKKSPENIVDNRYQNKIDGPLVDANKKIDDDKENVAHEVFDHNNNGGYDFGDLNEPLKNDNQANLKQHIDTLRVGGDLPIDMNKESNNKNYDNNAEENDIQVDDPEEDDGDGDEYADNFARQKDPAVRN